RGNITLLHRFRHFLGGRVFCFTVFVFVRHGSGPIERQVARTRQKRIGSTPAPILVDRLLTANRVKKKTVCCRANPGDPRNKTGAGRPTPVSSSCMILKFRLLPRTFRRPSCLP